MDHLHTPQPTTPCHVVALPFPGRGHINPMMCLCHSIAAISPDTTVSFIVTQEWLGFIGSDPKPDNVRFVTIPQVIPSEIGRGKDSPAFYETVLRKIKAPVEELLDRLELPVTALIADTYLVWSVEIGNVRNIPVASLWTMSASVYSVFQYFDLLVQNHHFPVKLAGMSLGEIECLTDSGSTDTILRNRQLFLELGPCKSSVTTMIGSSPVILGCGTTHFFLPHGTMIHVTDPLYAPKGHRTLLSFKDIRANGFHLETHCENGTEFLCITSHEYGRKSILEKLMSQSSGLYLTTIRIVESDVVAKQDLWDSDSYELWHDRIGHPERDMMIRILRNSHGHPFFRSKRKHLRSLHHSGDATNGHHGPTGTLTSPGLGTNFLAAALSFFP